MRHNLHSGISTNYFLSVSTKYVWSMWWWCHSSFILFLMWMVYDCGPPIHPTLKVRSAPKSNLKRERDREGESRVEPKPPPHITKVITGTLKWWLMRCRTNQIYVKVVCLYGPVIGGVIRCIFFQLDPTKLIALVEWILTCFILQAKLHSCVCSL